LIESYAFRVVAEKQERLRQLEKENQELRQKLQELTEQSKGVSHSP
jgi:IS1 family transposase